MKQKKFTSGNIHKKDAAEEARLLYGHRMELLLSVYGLIEISELCTLYREYYGDTEEAVLRESIGIGCRKGAYRMFRDNNTDYVTVYSEATAGEICRARERYPVMACRRLTKQELTALETEKGNEWNLDYGRLYRYLRKERFWEPEEIQDFLTRLTECLAVSCTERELKEWAVKELAQNQEELNRDLQNMILRLRSSWPSAALKGRSLGDYDKLAEGYRQLSLFDEENQII